MKKRIISIFLVAVTVFILFSVNVSAKDYKGNYGYIIPCDKSFSNSVTSQTLYGNNDYIYLYADCKEESGLNIYYCFELYSDKNYENCVREYSYLSEADEYRSMAIGVNLSKLKSGTYYAITYTAIEKNGTFDIDTSCVFGFKVVIKRSTSSVKTQTVVISGIKDTVNGPKISWNKIPNASKYIVYRKKTGSSSWSKLATVKSSKLYYTDTSVKDASSEYLYTVKAFDKDGNKSKYLNVGVLGYHVPAPKAESATLQENNEISISWTKVSKVSGYYIYRKEIFDGSSTSWKKIGSASYSKTTYTDKTTKISGATYKYMVKAYKNFSDGNVLKSANYTSYPSVKFIEAPLINKIEACESGLKVTWGKVTGATSYKVMRKPLDSSEEFAVMGTVSGDTAEFIDKTAAADGAYLYTVCSDGKDCKGSYSSSGFEYIILKTPKITKAVTIRDNDKVSVEFRFDVSPYTSEIKVYLKNENGKWENFASFGKTKKATAILGYNLKSIENYEFAIKTIRKKQSTKLPDTGYICTYYPEIIPTSLVLKDGIKLTWYDVGADEYKIYRTKSGTDKKELIATVPYNYYVDAEIEDDTLYTYEITYTYNGKEIITDTVNSINAGRLSDNGGLGKVSLGKQKNKEVSATWNNPNNVDCILVVSRDNKNTFCKYIIETEEKNSYLLSSSSVETVPMSVTAVKVDGDLCYPFDKTEFAEKTLLGRPESSSYSNGKTGITLSWKPVENASYYKITYGNKKITSEEPSAFIPYKSVSDTFMEYTVITYDENGNYTKKMFSAYSYAPPEDLKLSIYKSHVNIEITDCLDTHNKYNLYRKAEGEDSWKLIKKDVDLNGYYDKSTKLGKKYCYKAVVVSKGKEVSEFSDEYSVYCVPEPTLSKIENVKTGVKITWKKVSVATSYAVYRKTGSEEWKKIATVSNPDTLSYIDKKGVSGTKYQYSVIAYYNDTYSPISKTLTIYRLNPVKLTSATSTSKGIKLKWESVAGAKSYCVWRKTGSGDYKFITYVKDGSAVSYVDASAKKGKTYTYYVEAKNRDYHGDHTNTMTCTAKY